MNIYNLHFEGTYSHDIEVEAFDLEDELKIGQEMFDCADANEFELSSDPAPEVTLVEGEEDE